MDVKDQLVIDSRLDAVAEAREWLVSRTVQAGVSTKTINDLKLVLTEALSNVVRHAYDDEPGHPIELSLVVDAGALTLTIHDYGRPFDADSYQAPDLSDPQEGGYGVFLMHNLMDQVHYDVSSGTGTTLTLVKRRKDSPQQ